MGGPPMASLALFALQKERVTVLCSNLRPLVEPSLELQLNLLKEHIGIESFAAVYQ